MSQFFTSGGQSIGVSALASVFPKNTQDCFPLGLTGWTSLQPKGFSKIFSNTKFKNINSSALSFLYSGQKCYYISSNTGQPSTRICLQCRRPGFYPWLGRFPGEGIGNPLQYSCLENSIDRGTWQATLHGVAKS